MGWFATPFSQLLSRFPNTFMKRLPSSQSPTSSTAELYSAAAENPPVPPSPPPRILSSKNTIILFLSSFFFFLLIKRPVAYISRLFGPRKMTYFLSFSSTSIKSSTRHLFQEAEQRHSWSTLYVLKTSQGIKLRYHTQLATQKLSCPGIFSCLKCGH